jgi:hypothetical protein
MPIGSLDEQEEVLDVDYPPSEVGKRQAELTKLGQQFPGIPQTPLHRVDKHPGVADQTSKLSGYGAMVDRATVEQVLVDTGQIGDPGVYGSPRLRLQVPAPDQVVSRIGVDISNRDSYLDDIIPVEFEINREIVGVSDHGGCYL